ncbi:MAG: AccI family restriction endonuclease [Chthoniobacteraceae bacterium]
MMNRPATYFERLKETCDGVVENLTAKDIQKRHLVFGGEGEKPSRKPSVPTDARSEFLANRAMGDWAEQKLAQALAESIPEWKIAQYGDTGRIAAGHPEFRDTYLTGIEATRQFGKRPDLLLFSKSLKVKGEFSAHGNKEEDELVKKAAAAIEVRSSKFDALTYIAVRQRQRSEGNKAGRESPSFTVKVEDLVIVYRWLERYGVPQSYCQVFFDSIFAINFLDIFSIIASGEGYSIETPAKSQEKATIMIPITAGIQVGTATSAPEFTAEHRRTELGRHDAYVIPVGGGFTLDAGKIRNVLMI